MSNPPNQADRPEVSAEGLLRNLVRLNAAQLQVSRNLQAAFLDLRNAVVREQTRDLQLILPH